MLMMSTKAKEDSNRQWIILNLKYVIEKNQNEKLNLNFMNSSMIVE
jgi:hypothetical protein